MNVFRHCKNLKDVCHRDGAEIPVAFSADTGTLNHFAQLPQKERVKKIPQFSPSAKTSIIESFSFKCGSITCLIDFYVFSFHVAGNWFLVSINGLCAYQSNKLCFILVVARQEMEIIRSSDSETSAYLGVSENSVTPKSSTLIGFSIINHPFWGTVPLFLETPIYNWQTWWCVTTFLSWHRWWFVRRVSCYSSAKNFTTGVGEFTKFACTSSIMKWMNSCKHFMTSAGRVSIKFVCSPFFSPSMKTSHWRMVVSPKFPKCQIVTFDSAFRRKEGTQAYVNNEMCGSWIVFGYDVTLALLKGRDVLLKFQYLQTAKRRRCIIWPH